MDRVLRGSVFHRHEIKPFFSVLLDNRDYCVIELVDGTVSFGDVIEGKMEQVGVLTIWNITKNFPIEVKIHHVQCSRVEALQRTTMI